MILFLYYIDIVDINDIILYYIDIVDINDIIFVLY